jgi:hypothetical protein
MPFLGSTPSHVTTLRSIPFLGGSSFQVKPFLADISRHFKSGHFLPTFHATPRRAIP